LPNDYQNRFIQKIKENFTEPQQRLFVSSFYTYLNYNSKTDFIIDMIDVWKWLGFSRKEVFIGFLIKLQLITNNLLTKKNMI
jgi:hypothetical protein